MLHACICHNHFMKSIYSQHVGSSNLRPLSVLLNMRSGSQNRYFSILYFMTRYLRSQKVDILNIRYLIINFFI